jgi:hypothetical protein
MSVEYWLIDAESGNAQGCYMSLADALEAAETEIQDKPLHTLSLLGMSSHARSARTERAPEPKQRLFVRLDLGLTQDSEQ